MDNKPFFTAAIKGTESAIAATQRKLKSVKEEIRLELDFTARRRALFELGKQIGEEEFRRDFGTKKERETAKKELPKLQRKLNKFKKADLIKLTDSECKLELELILLKEELRTLTNIQKTHKHPRYIW